MDTTKLWPDLAVSPLNWWGFLAGKLGYDPLARPLLICIRGVEPFALTDHPNVAQPGFHDAGVLIYPAGQQVFAMSSVPYQTRSADSPDVNGDGAGDVACVAPGRYLLNDRHTDDVIFVVTNPDGSGSLPAARDLRHDGQLDKEGPAVYTATAVLLHGGTEEGHSSIACSTMPKRYRLLIRQKAVGGKCDYAIVTPAEVLTAMAGFDPGTSSNVA